MRPALPQKNNVNTPFSSLATRDPKCELALRNGGQVVGLIGCQLMGCQRWIDEKCTDPPARITASLQHFAQSTLFAPMLALTQISGRGLGLVAAQPIAAGEVVLSEGPLILYPQHSMSAEVCHHCLRMLGAGEHSASASDQNCSLARGLRIATRLPI